MIDVTILEVTISIALPQKRGEPIKHGVGTGPRPSSANHGHISAVIANSEGNQCRSADPRLISPKRAGFQR